MLVGLAEVPLEHLARQCARSLRASDAAPASDRGPAAHTRLSVATKRKAVALTNPLAGGASRTGTGILEVEVAVGSGRALRRSAFHYA